MDAMKKIGNSLLQYGEFSNRIYIMKVDAGDIDLILDEIKSLRSINKYSKVIVKVPEELVDVFFQEGFQKEAFVKGYYKGKKDGMFLAKYYTSDRKIDKDVELCKKVLSVALGKEVEDGKKILGDDYRIRTLTKKDVKEAVELYKQVFETYPFPIHEEKYLLETMEENLTFFGIWHKERLVALSSIEASVKEQNAEMTDFAVLDEYRGMGFSKMLLDEMESTLKSMGYKTAYTIARAKSFGMNITFVKNDYEYGGMLINNTQIAGDIESMNVWYKSLA